MRQWSILLHVRFLECPPLYTKAVRLILALRLVEYDMIVLLIRHSESYASRLPFCLSDVVLSFYVSPCLATIHHWPEFLEGYTLVGPCLLPPLLFGEYVFKVEAHWLSEHHIFVVNLPESETREAKWVCETQSHLCLGLARLSQFIFKFNLLHARQLSFLIRHLRIEVDVEFSFGMYFRPRDILACAD